MLVVERPRRAELLLLSVLALAPAAAPAQTGEPVVVRLNDAIGDTLDRAERDSFHLFPNTARFQHAVILALPGPEFYASIALMDNDNVSQVYYRVLPGQLERIRTLIDNHEQVVVQLQSDSSAARALASFWQEVEGHPLQSLGEGSVPARHTTLEADSVSASDREQIHSTTWENRYNYTLHGTTIGSAAGGCTGSLVGIRQVEAGGWSGGDWCVNNPTYAVNHPVFLGISGGLTLLGSTAGYLMGAERDRAKLLSSAAGNEGTDWRIGCAVGAAVPGALLGIWAGYMYTLLHNRVTGWIENDPKSLTMLPGAFTGVSIAVEVVTIGFQMGRAIDRRNAEKAEARRRALGR
jgi:hypothetical protein